MRTPVNRTGDWRIAITAQIAHDVPAAYPGGPSHRKGSFLSYAYYAKTNAHGVTAFPAPSSAAIALGMSSDHAVRAAELSRALEFRSVPSPDGGAAHPKDLTCLFDYLGHWQASAIFGIQSLEAFSNWIIGFDESAVIEFPREKDGKQFTARFSSVKAQRSCTLIEKLTKILPAILKLQSPEKLPQWRFLELVKKVRDEAVHMKSQQMFARGLLVEHDLFAKMIDGDPQEIPHTAFKVIEYFSETKCEAHQMPDWVLRFEAEVAHRDARES